MDWQHILQTLLILSTPNNSGCQLREKLFESGFARRLNGFVDEVTNHLVGCFDDLSIYVDRGPGPKLFDKFRSEVNVGSRVHLTISLG